MSKNKTPSNVEKLCYYEWLLAMLLSKEQLPMLVCLAIHSMMHFSGPGSHV